MIPYGWRNFPPGSLGSYNTIRCIPCTDVSDAEWYELTHDEGPPEPPDLPRTISITTDDGWLMYDECMWCQGNFPRWNDCFRKCHSCPVANLKWTRYTKEDIARWYSLPLE